MKIIKNSIFGWIALGLLFSPMAYAETEEKPPSLTISVRDDATGEPLSGIKMTMEDKTGVSSLKQIEYSGEDGTVHFDRQDFSGFGFDSNYTVSVDKFNTAETYHKEKLRVGILGESIRAGSRMSGSREMTIPVNEHVEFTVNLVISDGYNQTGVVSRKDQ